MGDSLEKQFRTSGSFENPIKFLSDSSYLRSIFPEEVWIKILEMVRLLIPENLENWSNSSPYFRHLLEDLRETFLFPKVFEILAPKYEKDYIIEQYQSNGSNFPKKIPTEFPLEPIHEIKKCRLVCRSWNKAIQNYYQDPNKPCGGESHFKMKCDHNQIYFYECTKSYRKIYKWKNCQFTCSKPQYPLWFVEHFEESHYLKKNPFIGRSVRIDDNIYDNEDEFDREFKDGLDQILENYGEEIWYLKIKIGSHQNHFARLYVKLKRWFTLMPNLRTLKIVHQFNRCLISEKQNWNCLEPLSEYLAPLQRTVMENPLAKLEKLEFLSVTNILAPIFHELIRRNGHITGLEIERWEVHERIFKYNFDYVLSSVMNLKQLAIHSFTEEELTKLEENIGLLRLQKFQLTDNINGYPFHWARLLGLLKGSSETLNDLVLELPFVGNKEGEDLLELTRSQMVGFGKVEKLLIFVGRPLFLDWMLGMKNSLRFLELVEPPYLKGVKGYDKVVGEQSIELFGFEEKMNESNIWKMFRKLEMVRIGEGYLDDFEEGEEFIRP